MILQINYSSENIIQMAVYLVMTGGLSVLGFFLKKILNTTSKLPEKLAEIDKDIAHQKEFDDEQIRINEQLSTSINDLIRNQYDIRNNIQENIVDKYVSKDTCKEFRQTYDRG